LYLEAALYEYLSATPIVVTESFGGFPQGFQEISG
jgi:hypothetical protein